MNDKLETAHTIIELGCDMQNLIIGKTSMGMIDIKARMYGILMDDLEHCKSFNEVSKFLLENLLYTDGSMKTSGRYQVWFTL